MYLFGPAHRGTGQQNRELKEEASASDSAGAEALQVPPPQLPQYRMRADAAPPLRYWRGSSNCSSEWDGEAATRASLGGTSDTCLLPPPFGWRNGAPAAAT